MWGWGRGLLGWDLLGQRTEDSGRLKNQRTALRRKEGELIPSGGISARASISLERPVWLVLSDKWRKQDPSQLSCAFIYSLSPWRRWGQKTMRIWSLTSKVTELEARIRYKGWECIQLRDQRRGLIILTRWTRFQETKRRKRRHSRSSENSLDIRYMKESWGHLWRGSHFKIPGGF